MDLQRVERLRAYKRVGEPFYGTIPYRSFSNGLQTIDLDEIKELLDAGYTLTEICRDKYGVCIPRISDELTKRGISVKSYAHNANNTRWRGGKRYRRKEAIKPHENVKKSTPDMAYCWICGKGINTTMNPEWVYKRKVYQKGKAKYMNDKVAYFCSWTCMRNFDKEKERNDGEDN